jgi:hypothetical protein
MPYIIKAVLGESLSAAKAEIERIKAGVEAGGVSASRLTPTTLEVAEGGRRATESVVDNPEFNRERSTIYMEASSPAAGNLP